MAGLSLDAAKQAIEAAGFVFEDGGQQDSNLPAGTVSGTDPSGQAGRGTTIRVFTSNGNGTTVPDLTGMNAARGEGRARRGRPQDEGRQRQPDRQRREPEPRARTAAAKRGDEVTVTFDDGGGGNGTPGNG